MSNGSCVRRPAAAFAVATASHGRAPACGGSIARYVRAGRVTPHRCSGEGVAATDAGDWLTLLMRSGAMTGSARQTRRVAPRPSEAAQREVSDAGSHDCVVVEATASPVSDLVLDRDLDYDVKVTFVNGDASLDCITLKSRGK